MMCEGISTSQGQQMREDSISSPSRNPVSFVSLLPPIICAHICIHCHPFYLTWKQKGTLPFHYCSPFCPSGWWLRIIVALKMAYGGPSPPHRIWSTGHGCMVFCFHFAFFIPPSRSHRLPPFSNTSLPIFTMGIIAPTKARCSPVPVVYIMVSPNNVGVRKRDKRETWGQNWSSCQPAMYKYIEGPIDDRI